MKVLPQLEGMKIPVEPAIATPFVPNVPAEVIEKEEYDNFIDNGIVEVGGSWNRGG
jgi:hypothetical protein